MSASLCNNAPLTRTNSGGSDSTRMVQWVARYLPQPPDRHHGHLNSIIRGPIPSALHRWHRSGERAHRTERDRRMPTCVSRFLPGLPLVTFPAPAAFSVAAVPPRSGRRWRPWCSRISCLTYGGILCKRKRGVRSKA
jgi:hypothetical protein